jgi:DNA-binding NarL/FixJ family response regulator
MTIDSQQMERRREMEMTKSHPLILIMVSPGPLRDGLHALVMTIPRVKIVHNSSGLDSLLRMGGELQPDLVLLDANLPGNEDWIVLRQVKETWSQSRCLVLADNAQQRHEAEFAGAEVVLPKGFRAARLFETIQGLLS